MNGKDFSSWLIVSDIDGTLNNNLRKTPEVNIKAINSFVHECGGNFTLASARNVQSLRPHYKNLPELKTPAIVLNGAGIYDFNSEKMIWFNSVPDSAIQIIKRAMDKFSSLEIGIFTDDMIYLVRPRILGPCMMSLDSLNHKKCKSINEVPKSKWGKVIFFCWPWLKSRIKTFVEAACSEDLRLIDTAVTSFDLVNESTHKGNAILELAKILGIPEDNIGAIGDYYNDLDMLKTVRHPACCKQAPEDLYEVSEFHACHCNDGAVADFLGYIMNNY